LCSFFRVFPSDCSEVLRPLEKYPVIFDLQAFDASLKRKIFLSFAGIFLKCSNFQTGGLWEKCFKVHVFFCSFQNSHKLLREIVFTPFLLVSPSQLMGDYFHSYAERTNGSTFTGVKRCA